MPWRVRFANRDVRDLSSLQLRLNLKQVRFIARRETDGVGAGREVAGTGLTGRVDELR
jgi:hypothetical protein